MNWLSSPKFIIMQQENRRSALKTEVALNNRFEIYKNAACNYFSVPQHPRCSEGATNFSKDRFERLRRLLGVVPASHGVSRNWSLHVRLPLLRVPPQQPGQLLHLPGCRHQVSRSSQKDASLCLKVFSKISLPQQLRYGE